MDLRYVPTPDLGVIERQELPDWFDGREVVYWTIPGFMGANLGRREVFTWLQAMAQGVGGYPREMETANVTAWVYGLGGLPIALYTAQVKLPR